MKTLPLTLTACLLSGMLFIACNDAGDATEKTTDQLQENRKEMADANNESNTEWRNERDEAARELRALREDLVREQEKERKRLADGIKDAKKRAECEARIAELTATGGAALREAKQVLAQEVTRLSHGEEAVTQAESASRALFAGEPDADDPNIPTTRIAAADIASMTLADLFTRAELVASRGEARRKAAEGALSIDGERVSDVDAIFAPDAASVLLRFGKKRYRRVVIGD